MHAKTCIFLFFILLTIINPTNINYSKKYKINQKKTFYFIKKSGKVTMLFLTHLIHKEIDKDGKNLYR